MNREFQKKLRDRVVSIASEYGRYGYRQVTGMLNMEGWDVGKDRVFSIWRKEGLKVPQKQPKRARLWLTDGSCIRQRPEYVNHVWSYDFVSEQTHDGRKFKILNVVDEFSRECLLSLVARRIRSQDVILALADLFFREDVLRIFVRIMGPSLSQQNCGYGLVSLMFSHCLFSLEVLGKMATANHLMVR